MKHDGDEEAPNTSATMVSATDVDHLLGMFDNVYEDAFFKTWDNVEVNKLPVRRGIYSNLC